MPVLLKDIPDGKLTQDEAEALTNGTFDYADRERVSLREAKIQYRKEAQAKMDIAGILEVNKVFGSNHELPQIPYTLYNIYDPGKFTFREKAFEITKAAQRGAGSIIKLPGVALKALGESYPTRKEREETGKPERFVDKGIRKGLNMVRLAGNKYIENVNRFMEKESAESQIAKGQPFLKAPIYRALSATAESTPTYGLAVVTSVTTGNPNIGLWILGTTTASSAYEGYRAQGVDPDLAMIGSLLEGSIEMITEKIPMDILMKSGGRPFLIRALKVGTAESFQELFAQLGQNYVNAVTKDVDPENYNTILKSAQQEWSIISQGWQDAMAAGFLMGGGAAAIAPSPNLGFKTADQMRAEYGIVPRNESEFLYMVDKIKQKVKTVEKESKKPKTEPAPPAPTAAEPAVKQAWEMTLKEYLKNEGVFRQKSYSAEELKKRNEAATLHKNNIQQALSEGKPVPASVLAEYPDLAKQAKSGIIPSMAEEKAARDNIEPSKQQSKREGWEAKQGNVIKIGNRELSDLSQDERLDVVATIYEQYREIEKYAKSKGWKVEPGAPSKSNSCYLVINGKNVRISDHFLINRETGYYAPDLNFIITDKNGKIDLSEIDKILAPQDTAEAGKGKEYYGDNLDPYAKTRQEHFKKTGKNVWDYTKKEWSDTVANNYSEPVKSWIKGVADGSLNKNEIYKKAKKSGKQNHDNWKKAYWELESWLPKKPLTQQELKAKHQQEKIEFENKVNSAIEQNPDDKTLTAISPYGEKYTDAFGSEWLDFSNTERTKIIKGEIEKYQEEKDRIEIEKREDEERYQKDLEWANGKNREFDRITEYAKSKGLEIDNINEGFSGFGSLYVDITDPATGATLKVRMSDHHAPGGAGFNERTGERHKEPDLNFVLKDPDSTMDLSLIDYALQKEAIGELEGGSIPTDYQASQLAKLGYDDIDLWFISPVEAQRIIENKTPKSSFNPPAPKEGGKQLTQWEQTIKEYGGDEKLSQRVKNAREILKGAGAIKHFQVDPVTGKWQLNLTADAGINLGVWADEAHAKTSPELGSANTTEKIERWANNVEIPLKPPGEVAITEPEGKGGFLDNLTPEENAELEKLEKKLSDKIKTQLNVGLDPDTFILATKIGSYYVKAGYRAFSQWAAKVRARIGAISDYTLRTIYSSLREQNPDLDSDAVIDASLEIGEGELKPRGTSVNVLAQAIEEELLEEEKLRFEDIPNYKAMSMKEQSEKIAAYITSDIEAVKRWAFYKESSPPDVFPENAFTGLRAYATQTGDVDLIMELALNENAVRHHTIMGKRIKSLDTDQDFADPIAAIREIVDARKEEAVRKGKDISALEVKLRELQAELDRTQKAATAYTKKAKREYGTKNKLVSRAEYDTIIARRKAETAELGFAGRSGGMAYIPNAQDFTDIAKIAAFHLEAMGRDFAKWSYQMTRDFGDWITPHLQAEYDKAIKFAKEAGIEIPEAKRLAAKKKRLATATEKLEGKFTEQDFAKVPQFPIELDEEGQRLQDAYDIAREKYKAAQAVANIITEEEVRIIAQLAKEASDRKAVMEKSERRKEGEGATDTELEYGVAMTTFLEYVNDLKAEANKRTMKEIVLNYITNPIDFASDLAGTFKAVKASLDNSFHGRQGLRTFLKGITGDIKSAKIWWATFAKSFKIMWNTLHKRKAMQLLSAEMISDPDYDLLKQSKVALHVIEEEIPVDLPSRIPLVGMLFRMGENAFVGSSRYMRYRLAKQYLNIWRKSGIELTKKELESIGKLANSQTGRGESAAKSQTPGLLNNLFWSPRNLRAHIDVLTLHLFDRNFSAFARKQAAINLLRYISGAAMILAIADWIDDDSVTWDTNSADFGKIKIGNTRFSVGGGMEILIILASRLITRQYTSSTTGKTTSIDLKKWGALSGKDLVFNFFENKLSPGAQLALSIIDQKTRSGENLSIPQMANDALTPLIIQNVFETGSSDDAANVLAALMAEALGVNVQTYAPKNKNIKRHRKSY